MHVLAAAAALAYVALGSAALPAPHEEQRPGTTIEYRLQRGVEAGRDISRRFTPSQRAVLEKLNRADGAHLSMIDVLVVPTVWRDELGYSPFPAAYRAAIRTPALLIVDQRAQAFAAYAHGRLVRWGPVSSGRPTSPTPSALFHLTWRSRGRYSTAVPGAYLKWYFNFDNARGLAFHGAALPGYAASHGCVRLLDRDARWLYDWGDSWSLDREGRIVSRGTPVLVVGPYTFEAPPPWRSLAFLARGIDLPAVLPPMTARIAS